MNVALLGGSFNPLHIGHWLAAHYVRATQSVDEVWLMPTFRHPFGKPQVDFEHRVRMCELVAAETAGWLKVSTVERDVGGEGRTVETLEHLKHRHPEHAFTLVIGSDILKDLPHWKRFDHIRAMASVLVLYRAGFPAPEAVGPPLAEVSSTSVRELFSRGAAAELEAVVPRGVLAYARRHDLYPASN